MTKFILIYAVNNKLHLRQFNDPVELFVFVERHNIQNYLSTRVSVKDDDVKELRSASVHEFSIDTDKLFFL